GHDPNFLGQGIQDVHDCLMSGTSDERLIRHSSIFSNPPSFHHKNSTRETAGDSAERFNKTSSVVDGLLAANSRERACSQREAQCSSSASIRLLSTSLLSASHVTPPRVPGSPPSPIRPFAKKRAGLSVPVFGPKEPACITVAW